MNAQKIKELNEQRGAKYKDYVALSDKTSLTADETARFNALETEIRGIDEALTRSAKALSLASSAAPTLSAKEERDVATFDLGKALRAMAGINGETLDGIEREIAQEGAKEAREAGVNPARGITLPRFIVRRQDRSVLNAREARTAMSATGTTSTAGDQGGMTIATQPIGLLDAFYAKLVLQQAGATVLEGLRGNVNFPRYVKDTDTGVKSENASAAALSPTTAMLSLSPKRYPAYVDISEQLLMQSSVAIEAVVRNNVASQLAAIVQKEMINGSTSGGIAGLLGTSGIGAIYAGGANTTSGTNANGAAQVFPDWVNLETAIASVDADIGSLGYVTNPKVRGQAKQTRRGKSTPSDTTATDSNMIWQNGTEVNGYNAYVTTSVPSNLTKGSSSTLSALVFGNWSDFYMGFWSGINLELLRDATIGIQGLYRLSASVYVDSGIVRPASFAAIKDIAA